MPRLEEKHVSKYESRSVNGRSLITSGESRNASCSGQSVRPNINIPIDLNYLGSNPELIPNTKTVILVHGHGATAANSTLNPHVKNAILTNEDVNVIVVDWTVYSRLPYSRADRHVAEVAMNIHSFLESQFLLLDPRLFHLVGFNLGAHIVGQTGRLYQGLVPRITALDPSKTNYMLSRTDAVYVEVIHTSGGTPVSIGLGIVLGDLDFFPNGGRKQPGCMNSTCNHDRAWWYFAGSQTPGTFMARCCSSQSQMNSINCIINGEIRMGGNDLAPKHGCPSGILLIETCRSYPFYFGY
ncbi:pancreatic lipase-related protein 2-like [Achroia grisella]|uniref:pancreatic lipase-related protein 2-like n=1 Tax=Achroia grisella TaxID=688607 RepID=UPI0027D3179D|nr:pancreatic lipase-related protein 2-like [Achroia grisella]